MTDKTHETMTHDHSMANILISIFLVLCAFTFLILLGLF
jgi:hypothetical protein